MRSSPLLTSSYLQSPKTLISRTFHRRPISKAPILSRNLHPKREPGGRIRRAGVTDRRKDMAEMVSMDAFGGADGGEDGDDVGPISGVLEVEGFETSLNRLSKWIVVAFFAFYILWRHDAEALWVAMGAVLNLCLSVTLKRILNQQRPVAALKSDPGMPSSHAQSLFYTATYVVISLFDWLGMNVLTMNTGVSILMCSCYLSWLRVSQQFHTISQVVVGAVVGSVWGVTWYWMWHPFVQAAFMANIWVRIVVVLGAVSLCAAFALYIILYWLGDEE